jgi:hypothetical protein
MIKEESMAKLLPPNVAKRKDKALWTPVEIGNGKTGTQNHQN